MDNCSRRFFIGGCASLGALAGCGKILMPGAASASGAKLKLGVLSDVHLPETGSTETFLKALTFFRDRLLPSRLGESRARALHVRRGRPSAQGTLLFLGASDRVLRSQGRRHSLGTDWDMKEGGNT